MVRNNVVAWARLRRHCHWHGQWFSPVWLVNGQLCGNCTTPWMMMMRVSRHFRQSSTSQSRLTGADIIAFVMKGVLNSNQFDIRVSDIEGVLRTTPWKMIRRSRHFKKSSTFHSRLTGASHAARKNTAPTMGGLLHSNGLDIIAFDTKGVLHSR